MLGQAGRLAADLSSTNACLTMFGDLRRHKRFLGAALFGILIGALLWHWPMTDRILLGADMFFAVFLALTLQALPQKSPSMLRKNSDDVDEGLPIILLIALTAIGLSLFGIIETMRGTTGGSHLRSGLALASIPLGWATLHCVMAFHYAGMWYALTGDGQDRKALDFGPGQPDPDMWDFFYYSFTIGMAAQTADVALRSRHFRKITLMHAVLSFFFNTVIVALAVGAASTLVQ
ncbi:DUF1345 domain-containing protein [Paracoccus aurantiacus]|uniref:DUF1345 domain-containing protein n=1 Tax=Paracoccus aurantiacus TaxID=2599412 RepID=A0A5C6SC25_9RHOB|nr:DUF1345 domain-containing protein [Paracoccus aurantiacus]TXB71155.1 DUF1345 domain-containing protein [Paracoccus aurantiacus]